MAMLTNWPDFLKAGTTPECAPLCGAVRGTAGQKQDSMAVSFFGGQDGAGARVWSAGKFVSNPQDQEQLRARIRELESLCTDVLVAGVDIGLPQHLLNQLWAAVGHGELPKALHVDLPPVPPRPVAPTPQQKVLVAPAAFTDKATAAPAVARQPMEIPDIPLTTNPLTANEDARPKPPQAELKPLNVKKTVCVVDDDPMMLDVLARILQRENFELLMASGGPEIAPILPQERYATTVSGSIGRKIPTRSPLPTPRAVNAFASRLVST